MTLRIPVSYTICNIDPSHARMSARHFSRGVGPLVQPVVKDNERLHWRAGNSKLRISIMTLECKAYTSLLEFELQSVDLACRTSQRFSLVATFLNLN